MGLCQLDTFVQLARRTATFWNASSGLFQVFCVDRLLSLGIETVKDVDSMKITKRSTLAAVASFFFGSWFTPRLSGAQANSEQDSWSVSVLLEDLQPRLGESLGHENRDHSEQLRQTHCRRGVTGSFDSVVIRAASGHKA
jgi:hypothetical protein